MDFMFFSYLKRINRFEYNLSITFRLIHKIYFVLPKYNYLMYFYVHS